MIEPKTIDVLYIDEHKDGSATIALSVGVDVVRQLVQHAVRDLLSQAIAEKKGSE